MRSLAHIAQVALGLVILVLIGVQTVIVPMAARETLTVYPDLGGLAAFGVWFCVLAIGCIQVLVALVAVLIGLLARESAPGRVVAVMTAVCWCAISFVAVMVVGFAVLSSSGVMPAIVFIGLVGGAMAGTAGALVLIVVRGRLRADLARRGGPDEAEPRTKGMPAPAAV